MLILRADNKGEGGIIELMSLIPQKGEGGKGKRFVLVLMGLFGAALLYGDGMIKPAISVLSAIEGLSLASRGDVTTASAAAAEGPLDPYIIPITIVILFCLFKVQRKGTAGVGAVFCPVTLVWFITLGVLCVRQIIMTPVASGPSIHATRCTSSPRTASTASSCSARSSSS